jgi:hypothetical protein
MKILFWISAIGTLLTLAPSMLYWGVYASTGEALARQRAVAFFRFSVVIVLGTFNIWIFTRVGGALKDIWFPSPPPAVVAPVEGDEQPQELPK